MCIQIIFMFSQCICTLCAAKNTINKFPMIYGIFLLGGWGNNNNNNIYNVHITEHIYLLFVFMIECSSNVCI